MTTGIGLVLIAVGLVGSVIPILPGPALIWLGAVMWAWGDTFQRVGWPTLAVLGVLAIAAWGSDLVLTTVFSRRAGASWKAIGAAILGGVAGAALLGGMLPIVGSILGAMAGAVLGMWAVEYYARRDRQAATTAVRAYMLSMIVAAFVELGLSVLMVAIFAWQALL